MIVVSDTSPITNLIKIGRLGLLREVFQSVISPDKLTLLERWTNQAALDVHAQVNTTRPPLLPELRVGQGEREDYEYNRTR